MSKQMMTVKLAADQASPRGVREKLGLSAEELDDGFGVVNIDPEAELYAIMVEEEVAHRLTDSPAVSGPFANPPIEPFGPPKR